MIQYLGFTYSLMNRLYEHRAFTCLPFMWDSPSDIFLYRHRTSLELCPVNKKKFFREGGSLVRYEIHIILTLHVQLRPCRK